MQALRLARDTTLSTRRSDVPTPTRVDPIRRLSLIHTDYTRLLRHRRLARTLHEAKAGPAGGADYRGGTKAGVARDRFCMVTGIQLCALTDAVLSPLVRSRRRLTMTASAALAAPALASLGLPASGDGRLQRRRPKRSDFLRYRFQWAEHGIGVLAKQQRQIGRLLSAVSPGPNQERAGSLGRRSLPDERGRRRGR